MADPQPVVTVLENTPGGTLVRWFRSLGDARNQAYVLVATAGRVFLGGGGDLTDVPDEWIAAARAAHRALADGADVSHLATHRSRFPGGGGPLEPVTPPVPGGG